MGKVAGKWKFSFHDPWRPNTSSTGFSLSAVHAAAATSRQVVRADSQWTVQVMALNVGKKQL